MVKRTSIIPILLALFLVAACGIHPLPVADRDAKTAFAEVLDLYHDRVALTDRATAMARRYLAGDLSVIARVDEARAAVVAIHATPDIIDTPAGFDRFDVAQRQLTESISQLMVVCESLHRLDADARFRALQAQLAYSARRIAAARERYDDAAQRYNASLRRFPLDLAQVVHAEADKPTFAVPDSSPVRRHPRTDYDALRSSLRV